MCCWPEPTYPMIISTIGRTDIFLWKTQNTLQVLGIDPIAPNYLYVCRIIRCVYSVRILGSSWLGIWPLAETPLQHLFSQVLGSDPVTWCLRDTNTACSLWSEYRTYSWCSAVQTSWMNWYKLWAISHWSWHLEVCWKIHHAAFIQSSNRSSSEKEYGLGWCSHQLHRLHSTRNNTLPVLNIQCLPCDALGWQE